MKSIIIAFKMQISTNNTLFARSAMTISKQQSDDGTCLEDNRQLNRFEIESDEQCEQWLLPETIAIGSRSIQSEPKAVSN
jgi:hypothetical protein